MATIQTLKKHLYVPFDDYGGCASPDYQKFERAYKSYLKAMAKEIGGELVKFNPNHYEFSCFIKRNDKFVYVSISDVRYWQNRWYTCILVRTAKHEKDFTGGPNDYASLEQLKDKVMELTK